MRGVRVVFAVYLVVVLVGVTYAVVLGVLGR